MSVCVFDAFFAFLWLFMGRITARFTHTGDGQRLGALVTDYQISGNDGTAFSQIGFLLNKRRTNKKLHSKHCNNDSAPMRMQILRFVKNKV